MNFSERKRLLETVSSVIDESTQIEKGIADKRHAAVAAINEFLDRKTHDELRQISIEDLSSHPQKGIRWDAFSSNGLTNAAEIAGHEFWELRSYSGIGEKSAQKALGLVRALGREIRERQEIRFDSGNRAEHTDIIEGLANYRKVKSALDATLLPYSDIIVYLVGLHNEALPAGSRFRMFFRSREKKDQALAAITKLEHYPKSADFRNFKEDVRNLSSALRDANLRNTIAWNAFEQHSADFYALLEQLRGDHKVGSRGRGGLTEEIVKKVESLELRTPGLNVTLRGYQEFGAKYAIVQEKTLLGDEMGLGKTIQSLAFIAHLKADGCKSFLVVCPASVLVNWEREISNRTRFQSIRLHGDAREANLRIWEEEGGIALTTFDTFRILHESHGLASPVLIVDEAHFIKNPKAMRTQALHAATRVASYALYLTGTPMENRLREFKILAKALDPTLFFLKDDSEKLWGTTATFHEAVAPVYLRRNQEDVLTELPERIENVHFLEPCKEELEIYWSAPPYFESMRKAASVLDGVSNSIKLEKIREIVEEACANDRKVLIFSHFRDALAVIASGLDHKVFGPISGSTSTTKRQEIVEAFTEHDGFAVLVSQIQAGGVGMNVQAASVVILTEPQWKPSTEEQAIARAHRMGQIETVLIHRLYYLDTVDMYLLAKLEEKIAEFNRYVPESAVRNASVQAITTESPDDLAEFLRRVKDMSQDEIVQAERQRHGLN